MKDERYFSGRGVSSQHGGGFMYVGAMHDSFPHALELSKMGYNGFALIYRPDDPYTDLARAISFIYDHAEELEVKPDGYSLWGGSAGARMASDLGSVQWRKGGSMTQRHSGKHNVSKHLKTLG